MNFKVVAFLNNDAQVEIARAMAPKGCELAVFIKRGQPEAMQATRDADVLISTVPPFEMTADFYQDCAKLKLVQLLTAGYDKYDIAAARGAGVAIASNGGANSVGVAEHAILLMMALKRHLLRYHDDVISGKWWKIGDMPRIGDLGGNTLGIVGCNTIGKRLAKLARAFDMKVVYFDIARLAPQEEDDLGIHFRLLQELLRESDIVSLHVPLLPATLNMIGAEEIAMMKPSALLINTSRGQVVDEPALIAALQERRIAGAGLDVLAKEPPDPDNPLFALDNVLLTPHQAGHIVHYFEPALRNAFFNVQRMLSGELPNWVIPEMRGLLGANHSRIRPRG